MMCTHDGGVVDDVTLYRLASDAFMLCVNASNTADDHAWMLEVQRSAGLACQIADESAETALLALQGPDAIGIVSGLLRDGETPPRRWRYRRTELAGIAVGISRTGYTGEDGVEIYVRAQDSVRLWDRLLAAGERAPQPAGLGARDTLRLEMGYPLYGHELDRAHTPIEANLERFVAVGKGFIGEEALARARDSGPRQLLVGLVLQGRQLARAGFTLLAGDARGIVTSGSYGPSIERSIAMGYVPAESAQPGAQLLVEVRGRHVPCDVVGLPFYRGQGG